MPKKGSASKKGGAAATWTPCTVPLTPLMAYHPVDEFLNVAVKGFAWSGGGRGIVRVDLSIDGGVTWHEAELGEGAEQHPSQAWAWTFWSAELPLPSDTKSGERVQVICKATDAAYNTQPENAAPIWNARGLNNNSWHRVSAVVDTE